ncbi:stage III sporulation protein AH [Paenibacillus sp. DS2015]|uniref:SpoIIIAH-like family protein n=1 Tax=Paenibacillus sp. DS2015 TaxID=3373917 RepID=UPI003D20D389
MNNKRQTIWLVSMLSLMVVLSAYYLFTEDSGSSTMPVADSQQVVDQQNIGDKVVVTEVVTDGVNSTATTEETDATATTTETKETTDVAIKEDTAVKTEVDKPAPETDKTAAVDVPENAKNDDEILKEVASQAASSSTLLDSYRLDRVQTSEKEQNDLYATINDMNNNDPEKSAIANDQLRSLEEKETKITSIEEELYQQYGGAVVKEEEDHYKVLVLSEKLDVKQAVNIVDLVMKELNVSQDKVSVQYVSP